MMAKYDKKKNYLGFDFDVVNVEHGVPVYNDTGKKITGYKVLVKYRMAEFFPLVAPIKQDLFRIVCSACDVSFKLEHQGYKLIDTEYELLPNTGVAYYALFEKTYEFKNKLFCDAERRAWCFWLKTFNSIPQFWRKNKNYLGSR